MRTFIIASLALLLAGCAVAPAAQATVPPATSDVAAEAVQAAVPPATSDVAAEAVSVFVPPAAPEATTALASSDAAALAFMREEEKLARDVYQALAATWSTPVFTNIAASEQAHMDALKTLLDRYGLADPAATTAPGVFTNPDLQALYTQLVARGETSLSEALAVGAAIEEIDIRDLQERSTATTPADIAQVYQQLLQGSYNHLRAFAGQWEAQAGATYTPQYLDPDAYQVIIGAAGTGGSGNGGNGNGGHGNGGHGNGGGKDRRP